MYLSVEDVKQKLDLIYPRFYLKKLNVENVAEKPLGQLKKENES